MRKILIVIIMVIFLNSMFASIDIEKFYCTKIKTFTVKSEGCTEVTESSINSELKISALSSYFKQEKADYLVAYSDSNAIYIDETHWHKFEFKNMKEGDILLPSGEIINSNPSLDDGLHIKFSPNIVIDSNITVAAVKFIRWGIWETTSVIVLNNGRWLLLNKD